MNDAGDKSGVCFATEPRTKHSYQDLGPDYFERLEAPRLERHYARQLEQLGYAVSLSPQIA